MKTMFAAIAALMLLGSVQACDQCVGGLNLHSYVQPVTYRVVQPTLVRESVQFHQYVVERDPIIVERQERLVQYQVQPQIQLQVQKVQVQKVQVQKVQVQQVHHHQIQLQQKVQIQPVIVQKQYSQPTIQQQTVERRGILGRLRQRTTTTIVR